MDSQTKAEIRRQYKEQVQAKGIYCVRCTAGAQVWVDCSRNLEASENRLAFSLKTGSILNESLRQDLARFGADTFEFEVLEVFDPDLSAYDLAESLKERRKHWQQTLSAHRLER